jgi:hypothetical protein
MMITSTPETTRISIVVSINPLSLSFVLTPGFQRPGSQRGSHHETATPIPHRRVRLESNLLQPFIQLPNPCFRSPPTQAAKSRWSASFTLNHRSGQNNTPFPGLT